MTGISRRRVALAAIAIVCLGAPYAAFAQSNRSAATRAVNPRGVYATIDLGPADEMIARLNGFGSNRRAAIREVVRDPSAYMPPVLYALANALSEDHPEDAIYWYHLGRMRAVYDALRCKDESAQAAILVLRTRISRDLAASLAYQRDNLVAIAQKAIDFDTKNPPRYDHRWIALYGKVAAKSDGANADEITVPETEWPALLQSVHEAHLKAVRDFVNEKK
jgi:hypothetical protein